MLSHGVETEVLEQQSLFADGSVSFEEPDRHFHGCQRKRRLSCNLREKLTAVLSLDPSMGDLAVFHSSIVESTPTRAL